MIRARQHGSLRWLRMVAVLTACAGCASEQDAEPRGPGCVRADGQPDGHDLDDDGYCDRDRADWTAEARVQLGQPRANIYGVPDEALPALVDEGLALAQAWPVSVSGLFIPYEPIAYVLDEDNDDPSIKTAQDLATATIGFGTMPGLYAWLGLPAWNPDDAPWSARAPFRSPRPDEVLPGMPMGAAVFETQWGKALTFSCATCHAGRLLGKTVVGLNNRQPRANAFFHAAKTFLPLVTAEQFEDLAGADEGEVAMLERSRARAAAVGTKVPANLGLDTSLAQVALSLARRADDAYASFDPDREENPLPNALATDVADSKPMPWWTLKHKTRWLADGSIVSGNPVFTNFLWNELGRGTDLVELEAWMQDNRAGIEALTAAVFANTPPRWEDPVFDLPAVDIEAARRGKVQFDARCASCHGSYDKGWDAPDADARSPAELIATTEVRYHEQTPVFDVGTDPQRAAGMAAFADRLNELAISKWMETVVEVQSGYVPPPLDGIWSRYPYLHNGSVPTLCDLLRPASERPSTFWQGPSEDAATDFDATCVGYPTGDAIPASWQEAADAKVDTTRPGLSNAGHDTMLGPATTADGTTLPALDDASRADLIAFLKTL